MKRDEKGWKGMKRDEKGWKGMKRDEKGWKGMKRDEKGWKGMKRDEKGWKGMKRAALVDSQNYSHETEHELCVQDFALSVCSLWACSDQRWRFWCHQPHVWPALFRFRLLDLRSSMGAGPWMIHLHVLQRCSHSLTSRLQTSHLVQIRQHKIHTEQI